VDHIFDSASLSDDEKADILGRTAERLFDLKAQTDRDRHGDAMISSFIVTRLNG
jgi:hypothetical protein